MQQGGAYKNINSIGPMTKNFLKVLNVNLCIFLELYFPKTSGHYANHNIMYYSPY